MLFSYTVTAPISLSARHHIDLHQTHLAADAGGAAFSNVSFSIAASIILFPLMIEVVQMTMFLRPVRKNISQ